MKIISNRKYDEFIAAIEAYKELIKLDKRLLDMMGDKIEKLVAENEQLKGQIAEYDDLTEELDYRKREAKRLGWSSKIS